jgi:hypothetical protein
VGVIEVTEHPGTVPRAPGSQVALKIEADADGEEPEVNDTVNAELLPVTANPEGEPPAPLERTICGAGPEPAKATYAPAVVLKNSTCKGL